MIQLETPRLLLREFHESDADFLYELNEDPEVIRYTGDKSFKNIAEALMLIKNYDQYSKYRSGRLTVLLKQSKERIGWCGLKHKPDTGDTDLGYRFKRKFWNQGFASEAAAACINYGFTELNLENIKATALKENIASIRIMEKLGFSFYEEVREHDGLAVCYKLDNPNSTSR